MKKSGYTLTELMVLIAGVGTLFVAILIISLLVKGCNYVCDNGVKNVAEKVWNGSVTE